MTGVKISDLLAEKATAELQVGGATLKFVFYVLWRDRFTEDELSELLALRGRDYLLRVLPRVLQSWDIVDDDGHVVPVTSEAIDQHHIPDALLMAIERRALNSDLAGKAISNGSLGS